jgi:hypothetical protein
VATLAKTLTTYTGNTPQTGDAYAIVNSGTHGNAALKTLIDALIATVGVAGAGLTAVTTQVWAAGTRTLTAFDSAFKTGYALSATGIDAIAQTADGMVEMAKAVWDRLLSGATHNIAGSAGRRLRTVPQVLAREGTAQAGGASTITLDAGASTDNDFYVPGLITIVAGTGAVQFNRISAYDGATRVAAVSHPWVIEPDNTSEFQIQPWAAVLVAEIANDALAAIQDPILDRLPAALTGDGLMASDMLRINGSDTSAANLERSASVIYRGSITDASSTTELFDSALTQTDTDHWKGRIVIFTSGDLTYQASDITGFDPSTDKLTVTALSSAPTNGDTFVIV